MFKIFLFIVLVAVPKMCESATCDINPKTMEQRLKKDLFCEDYDKTLRPNGKNTTTIGFNIYLHTLSLEEHNEELNINAWIGLSWSDDKMKWDPKSYDTIKTINIPSDELWQPDISLYNSNQGQSLEACRVVDCFIQHSGYVNCILPCGFTGRCRGNYLNWPFDRQNCSLMFGSWTKTGEHLSFNANKTEIATEDFVQNNKWKLLRAKAKVVTDKYDCCPNDTYPGINCNFILERHSAPYAAFLLVPALIMITLNLTAFFLNCMSIERMIIAALNLFVHFQFIQQLAWYAPDNGGDVPLFVLYIRDSLILTTVIIIETGVLRYILFFEWNVPAYIDKMIDISSANIVGRYFMPNLNNDNNFVSIENDNDNANLVETKPTFSKQNSKWRAFANIIDTLLFIIYVLTYCIMLISLIPANDMDESKNTVETVVV